MISSRGYHYLVASVPDLRFGEPPPFALAEFLATYHDELTPEGGLVDVLVLRNDLANLKAVLGGSENWREPAVYPRDALEQAMGDREGLPEFMIHHIQAPEPATLDKNYLLYAASQPNTLLCDYFSFELRLRNVLAAIRARESGVDVLRDTAGAADDLYAQLIRENRSVPDFGLQGEAPWISRIVQAFEKGDPNDTEMVLDRIRFNHISELNELRDFQIEVVLGYILQLQILERWAELDAGAGYEYVRELSHKAMETR